VIRVAWALALSLSCACAAAPSARSASPVPAAGKTPYDAPPVPGSAIDIVIDSRAAREILESLGRPRVDASDVKILEEMPAVRYTIRDSTRGPDVFEHDFAAAFQSETRATVFDFRAVREKRERWQALLDAITARQTDLIRLSQRRAASLLPGDRPVAARLQVYVSFGLAGLEDHFLIRSPEGPEMLVIDFARALGDEDGPIDGQISRLSRLIAGEAYRQVWNAYREASPAWTRLDPQLGQLGPLLQIVAAAGPVGLFTVDENFFPLSVWLKDPMKRAVDDLNRRADRFSQAQENLEERVSLAAEIRRPDFGRRVAAPIGAFLADAIAQDAGAAGLRSALQAGPRAFFAAYDHAAQRDKNLIPLAKPIREKISSSSSLIPRGSKEH